MTMTVTVNSPEQRQAALIAALVSQLLPPTSIVATQENLPTVQAALVDATREVITRIVSEALADFDRRMSEAVTEFEARRAEADASARREYDAYLAKERAENARQAEEFAQRLARQRLAALTGMQKMLREHKET